MKISTNSRYAVRFLIQLAAKKDSPKQSVASIAQAEGLSEKMLERIAAKLKKAGFVISAKGVGGGYELNMDPNEITMTMILELMETPYLPLHCGGESDDCVYEEQNCPTYPVWQQIDEAIRKITDQCTIAQLATKINP